MPAKKSAEYGAWVDAIRRLLPAAPADVLDIACGTGFVSLIAAGMGHRVTGIDLSGAMLDEARAAVWSAGIEVDFKLGDAVTPPLDDGSFDAIICRHFLWTLREPDAAFGRWRALLRPGGRVVAIDGFWFRDQLADDAPPSEDDLFGRYYSKDTRDALPVMSMTTVHPIVEMFKHAGVGDVAVSHLADVHAMAANPPSENPWHVIVATRS